jgi:hypothetical protein
VQRIRIVVRALTSGAWTVIGGPVDTGYYPAIAIDANGMPNVVYRSGSGYGYVRAWSGSSWTQVGSALAPSGERFSVVDRRGARQGDEFW